MELADSPRAYSGFVPVILANMQTFLESAQLYLKFMFVKGRKQNTTGMKIKERIIDHRDMSY